MNAGSSSQATDNVSAEDFESGQPVRNQSDQPGANSLSGTQFTSVGAILQRVWVELPENVRREFELREEERTQDIARHDSEMNRIPRPDQTEDVSHFL